MNENTFDLIGDRFSKVEPFALFTVVDVAQAEVVLLHYVQLYADVIEDVLRLASRLRYN